MYLTIRLPLDVFKTFCVVRNVLFTLISLQKALSGVEGSKGAGRKALSEVEMRLTI